MKTYTIVALVSVFLFFAGLMGLAVHFKHQELKQGMWALDPDRLPSSIVHADASYDVYANGSYLGRIEPGKVAFFALKTDL